MDQRILGLMANMWDEQEIYGKLAGHFSSAPDRPSNSLAQGCSFSLIVTNLHTSVWMYFLITLIGGIKTAGFIDDVNMLHTCEKAIQAALQLTMEFNKNTGHQINLQKSAAFSIKASVRKRLRGMLVPVPFATRCLGQQYKCTKVSSCVVQDKAVQKYMKTVDRIAVLPVNRDRKIALCRTTAVKQLTFSTISTFPSLNMWHTARQKWMKAIFADTRQMKAVEIVLALHMRPTQTNPMFSSVATTILDLHRIFCKRKRFREWFKEIREEERGDEGMKFGGPVAQLVRSFKLLGASIDSNFVVKSEGRKLFSFVEVGKQWMANRLEVLARRKLLAALRERCDWDARNPEAERKKGRKDLKEISLELDRYANTTFLR